jgi:anti-sigma B factor antagonist
MKPDFDIELHDLGEIATALRLRGRLDARGASMLTARCAAVRASGRHLVLNLGAVTFIASSGVGALLALVEECRQSRTRVRLAEVPPSVDSVIRLLNLDQFLRIQPSEDDALGTLKAA